MNQWLWVFLIATCLWFMPQMSLAASPTEIDTDGDGLVDRLEQAFGTNPTLADTDGDGYKDGDEIKNAYSPTSTQPIHLNKSIQIKLATQVLSQQVNGITIAQFPVSSGKPGMPTPVGSFTILNKSQRAWSSAAKLWMPYWMAFDRLGHGIHELPEWPNGYKEGRDHLGRPVSHGCVRLGEGVAKMMYDWAPIGTKVTIEK